MLTIKNEVGVYYKRGVIHVHVHEHFLGYCKHDRKYHYSNSPLRLHGQKLIK